MPHTPGHVTAEQFLAPAPRQPQTSPNIQTQQAAQEALLQLSQQLAAQQQQAPTQMPGATRQQQLNAGLAGLVQLLNPNAQAPLAGGIATGLQALQQQRGQALQAAQQAHKMETQGLRDRIKGVQAVGDIAGDIESSQVSRAQLGLAEQREGRQEREFQADLRSGEPVLFMNPDTGRTEQFKQDHFGNILFEGKPVNPTAIGMVPFDRQLFQEARERQGAISQQAVFATEMGELVFNPAFPAAVGRLDFRKLATETLGIGQEREILIKRAKSLGGEQVLEDLDRMGVKPSDADRRFAEKMNLNVKDDPEVWQDKYVNRIVPHLYRRALETHGVETANTMIKPLVDKIAEAKRQGTLNPAVQPRKGSVVDKMLQQAEQPAPAMPTGGTHLIFGDGTGMTRSGQPVKIRKRGQDGAPPLISQ